MSQTKEKFSSVLVSIDGSEASMKAADYAIMTAKTNDAQLTALHVLYSQTGYAYSSGTFGGLVTPSSVRAIYESAEQEAQQWFDKIKEKISKQETEEQKEKNQIHLETELVVTATSVAAAIVAYSEQHDIDLIVIGTRGRSGFKKLLLGSVASGVATYAHCPVMIVK
jgi:nucleotide-binding universal stress UspA family protein